MNYDKKIVTNKLDQLHKSILELIKVLVEVPDEDPEAEEDQYVYFTEDGEKIELKFLTEGKNKKVRVTSKDLNIEVKDLDY